jgi:hypothetical protein
MDAVPALPPYAHITQEAVQCAATASLRYDVPELLLHAILMKENGRAGQCSKNSNGTYDCGVAQINTTWMSYFAKQGIKPEYLLGDTCTNIQAATYILRLNFNKKNDWFHAAVAYNIGPNNWTQARYAVGYRYAQDVVSRWWGFQRWVDAKNGVQRDTNGQVVGGTPPAAPSVGSKPKGSSRADHRAGMTFDAPAENE